MNATGLLLLLVGVFIIINVGNFLQVLQGKAKIGYTAPSRSASSTITGGSSAPKGAQ